MTSWEGRTRGWAARDAWALHAGEAVGIDKWLKANTVKRRTISLVRQGQMHYAALPKMKLDMLEPLMAKFGEMLRAQRVFREIFGLI